MRDLCEMLRENEYPGRGIVVGRNAKGEMCVYYFIMGRSVNSRNRVFLECEDGIRTEAHDPAKMEDASLIIYHPVRAVGEAFGYKASGAGGARELESTEGEAHGMRDCLVVTNGDQTDTIVEAGDFRAGCMAREYEPDAPNFTPRISAIVLPDGAFEMSILKADLDDNAALPRCVREFFAYEGCDAGEGRFISTYEGDANPLPSFSGEPVCVRMPAPEDVWRALNAENKVSLYANVGGRVKIFNKNLGE